MFFKSRPGAAKPELRSEREREMDDEIQSLFKVWITVISCLFYCYYIAARIPKGFLRLFSLFPIFYLFLILPFNLSSFHLGGPTAFYLAWLANFKLLLFSFNQGPLSLSPNIFHFISIASLPIKLNPQQPTINNNTEPPNKSTQKTQKPPKNHFFPKSILLLVKVVLLVLIICVYDYSENLHPHFILPLHCCHMYLGIEFALAISAAPARAIFGFEMEPQFNEPYLSTSLQDFWGRRWNLMVTSILRPTVYDPIRRICNNNGFVGPTQIATLATFLVSGLMHELIYYYLSRAPPTGEVTWFFVLQGVSTVAEVAMKKMLLRRGWRLHGAVSGLLTAVFLLVTGNWLFFPQLVRNGVVSKAIGEYKIVVNFF